MRLNPAVAGILLLVLGWALLVAGVYLLAGLAWALIASAPPFLFTAFIIFRGLTRGSTRPE